ncbi:MAG: nitroreductase [Lewinellaceae bacterium]|nr:nitroreductase [Phaeodactylibacter sp.]MCB0615318.1 nitroreductase [Phaeodactylibacter sp.]MCB9348436.1 nitroreductase [Lewinellaceae bacterium]
MPITAEQAKELIRQRRSVFPNTYTDEPIPDEAIVEILENANWAPTHKRTEPWRFKVFRGKALHRLGEYLARWYQEHTPAEQFLERKYNKSLNNPQRSSCVIAICMQRDPQERVPEWEEVAAVACAVQNMWLSCTAHGIGCYWSSPRSILEANEFLDLKEGERCLGLFYMGYHSLPAIPGKREPIENKVTWITE